MGDGRRCVQRCNTSSSRMLRLSVAFFGLLCLTSVYAADTEGTSFQALFFRNQLNGSQLTLDFINNGDAPVTVTLKYFLWDGNTLTKVPKTDTVNVDAGSYNTYTADANVIYKTIGPGLNIYPDLRIRISASAKISVYATNLATNKKNHTVGDTYLVLPDSMADTNFVVSLPDAVETTNNNDLWQMKVIYFLPIDDSVTITVQQFNALGSPASINSFAVHASPKSDLMYFAQRTGFGNSLFKISGSGKFLILAGVTCAPDATKDCDFAAYMPPPTVNTNQCNACSVKDDHITYTRLTDSYFMAAPPSCSGTVSYSVMDEASNSLNYAVDTTKFKKAVTAPMTGRFLQYTSTQAILQMTRIGDQSPQGAGLYLDIVPSLSQYLTGTTRFYVRAKSTITLFMDSNAYGKLTIDGSVANIIPGNEGQIAGWHVVFETVDAGLHTIASAAGSYSIEVQTAFNTKSYTLGFVPAYNKQHSDVPSNCNTPVPPKTTTTPLPTTTTYYNQQTTTTPTGDVVTTTTSPVTTTSTATTTPKGGSPTSSLVSTTTTIPTNKDHKGGPAQLSVSFAVTFLAVAIAFLNL